MFLLVWLILLLASSAVVTDDETCEKLRTGKVTIRAFGTTGSDLALFTSNSKVYDSISTDAFDTTTQKLFLGGLSAPSIKTLYPDLATKYYKFGATKYNKTEQEPLVAQFPVNFLDTFHFRPYIFNRSLNAIIINQANTVAIFFRFPLDGGTTSQISQDIPIDDVEMFQKAIPVSLTQQDTATVLYNQMREKYCVQFRLINDELWSMMTFDDATFSPKANKELVKTCRPLFSSLPTAITYSGSALYFFTADGSVIIQTIQRLTDPWTNLKLETIGPERRLSMAEFINCSDVAGKLKGNGKRRGKSDGSSGSMIFVLIILGLIVLGGCAFYLYKEGEKNASKPIKKLGSPLLIMSSIFNNKQEEEKKVKKTSVAPKTAKTPTTTRTTNSSPKNSTSPANLKQQTTPTTSPVTSKKPNTKISKATAPSSAVSSMFTVIRSALSKATNRLPKKKKKMKKPKVISSPGAPPNTSKVSTMKTEMTSRLEGHRKKQATSVAKVISAALVKARVKKRKAKV